MAAKAGTGSDFVPGIVADVFELAGAFRHWGDTIAGPVGQTQARWQVLSAAVDGNSSVAQLARRLGVTRQAVQRIADLLVADRLAVYRRNPLNARSPLLRLTKQGHELLKSLSGAAEKHHRELAEGLSLEELRTAAIVLGKMRLQLERDRLLEKMGTTES